MGKGARGRYPILRSSSHAVRASIYSILAILLHALLGKSMLSLIECHVKLNSFLIYFFIVFTLPIVVAPAKLQQRSGIISPAKEPQQQKVPSFIFVFSP